MQSDSFHYTEQLVQVQGMMFMLFSKSATGMLLDKMLFHSCIDIFTIHIERSYLQYICLPMAILYAITVGKYKYDDGRYLQVDLEQKFMP